jgi:hypothetical protein
MVRVGTMTPEEAATSELRNQLVRAGLSFRVTARRLRRDGA